MPPDDKGHDQWPMGDGRWAMISPQPVPVNHSSPYHNTSTHRCCFSDIPNSAHAYIFICTHLGTDSTAACFLTLIPLLHIPIYLLLVQPCPSVSYSQAVPFFLPIYQVFPIPPFPSDASGLVQDNRSLYLSGYSQCMPNVAKTRVVPASRCCCNHRMTLLSACLPIT